MTATLLAASALLRALGSFPDFGRRISSFLFYMVSHLPPSLPATRLTRDGRIVANCRLSLLPLKPAKVQNSIRNQFRYHPRVKQTSVNNRYSLVQMLHGSSLLTCDIYVMHKSLYIEVSSEFISDDASWQLYAVKLRKYCHTYLSIIS